LQPGALGRRDAVSRRHEHRVQDRVPMIRSAALTVAAALVLAVPAPAARASASCAAPTGGYKVSISRYVPFKNRFHETIAVDLYRPVAPSGCRFPVVLESSPYRDWINPQPT